MDTLLPTFSNARTEALIEDWPFGRQRCKARFQVEAKPRKGERVVRWTENKDRTGWNKPKATTFCMRCAIVDGNDGRTYILRQTCGHVNVMQGDMKYTAGSMFPGDEGYDAAMQLLKERNGGA